MDTIVKLPFVNTQGVCKPHFCWGFRKLWKNKGVLSLRPENSEISTDISTKS